MSFCSVHTIGKIPPSHYILGDRSDAESLYLSLQTRYLRGVRVCGSDLLVCDWDGPRDQPYPGRTPLFFYWSIAPMDSFDSQYVRSAHLTRRGQVKGTLTDLVEGIFQSDPIYRNILTEIDSVSGMSLSQMRFCEMRMPGQAAIAVIRIV